MTDDGCTCDPEHHIEIRARTALAAAMADPESINDIMEVLVVEHSELSELLMLAQHWIDDVRAGFHLPDHSDDAYFGFQVADLDSDTPTPPGYLWAGQVMSARFNGDQDQFQAIVAAVIDDPTLTYDQKCEHFSDGIAAILHMCATAITEGMQVQVRRAPTTTPDTIEDFIATYFTEGQ